MITKFPEFCGLSLEQKKEFDIHFSKTNPESAEFSFGYLYSWRKPLDLSCANLDGFIIVKGMLSGSPFCFEPIGEGIREEVAMRVLEYLKNRYGLSQILSATKSFAGSMRQKYTDSISVSEKREYFDYVYLADDLALLPGEKYQKKRNFVNRFLKENGFIYNKIIETGDTADCLNFQKEWCARKKCKLSKSLIDEDEAIKEMLNNFESLELCGCMIYVKGKTVAFSVGEKLNSETYVTHIEKAFTEHVGAYQTMNKFAAEIAKSQGFKYINREEDLGQVNLRKAKLSYHPIRLVKKYSISLSPEFLSNGR